MPQSTLRFLVVKEPFKPILQAIACTALKYAARLKNLRAMVKQTRPDLQEQLQQSVTEFLPVGKRLVAQTLQRSSVWIYSTDSMYSPLSNIL